MSFKTALVHSYGVSHSHGIDLGTSKKNLLETPKVLEDFTELLLGTKM